MPLLDTDQGLHKNKFMYWSGLMPVACVVLFIDIGANVSDESEINLLAVVLATTGVLTYYLVSDENIYVIDVLN